MSLKYGEDQKLPNGTKMEFDKVYPSSA